ncbi:hypothetical protein PG993_014095 [Apiospora rasikravindrae]|uniref:Uncharacterized protein n=1 Tax=Apiospora rasikravindrae TaxID=990691 RepID=A0ABR1RS24_9PEZI
MAEKNDPNKEFEYSFRTVLKLALGNKVRTGKEAIQKSRDIIRTQFNAVNEEIRSFHGTGSDLLAFSGDGSDRKQIAQSLLTEVSKELLEELMADWAWGWDSEHLRLSASNSAVPSRRPETPHPEVMAPESLAKEEERPVLNDFALRILKDQGYDKILNSINDRPAVPLGFSGYVFEWPPGSGVHCVIGCQQCNFTSNTNPLELNHTFVVKTHWYRAHPEWKGTDSYALFSHIMTAFVFRIVANRDYTGRRNETDKRKRMASQQRAFVPASPGFDGAVSGKGFKRRNDGFDEDSIVVATSAKRAAHQRSNTPQTMPSLLALRPATSSARGSEGSQLAKNVPRGDDHVSSDDEPLLGKRPRWAIRID